MYTIVQQRDLFPYLSCLHMRRAHVVLRSLPTISSLLELQYCRSARSWRIPGLRKYYVERDANQALA
jgi:hypothetical protein